MKSRKRKTRKPSSKEYLPPEVLTQILANLPVKSVLRFRCVCKSWCSIIDDPDFISTHLQLCNTNPFNSDKLLALEGLSGGLSGSLLTLRKADNLRKTGHIFKCSRTYDIQGSCNSLILISCYHTSMRLCNPSIRKSLLIPECPFQEWSIYTSFVLGFALRTKDVKVIAITTQTMQFEIPEMRVVVYTLSDRQWTVRDNGLDINALFFKQLFGQPYYFCEGAAHWLGMDSYGDSRNQDGKPTHLASLDFDTESFTFLELPQALDEVINITLRCLFLLGDSLAFLCISAVSLKIWVLKQKSGKREWTLWFSGPSSSDGFNMFCYRRSGTRVLYHRGDGGSLLCGKKSYNISTCQVQSFGKSISPYVELETYYESLVLCKGYGALDIASFPFCEDE